MNRVEKNRNELPPHIDAAEQLRVELHEFQENFDPEEFVQNLDMDDTIEFAESLRIPMARKMIEKYIPNKDELLTVPNAISLLGFLLVCDGARKIETVEGVHEITLGRGLDVLDGFVARKTGKTSEFGAALDATLDKLGMLIIGAAAWKTEAAPRSTIAAIGATEFTSAAFATIHTLTAPNDPIRPTRFGKLGMFSKGGGLIAYLYSNAYLKKSYYNCENTAQSLALDAASQILERVGFAASMTGLALSCVGNAQYAHRANKVLHGRDMS